MGPKVHKLMKKRNDIDMVAPVTPAIHNGWAPKTEKMKAAMKDESNTSATPYSLVVSIKSREKAMPGRTLRSVSCR